MVGMPRLSGIVFLLCLYAGIAHGMDCTLGTGNVFEKIVQSCPGLFQSSSKSYCCYDIVNEKTYCCTLQEFFLDTGLGIGIPLIIVISIVISLVVCCVSCLCCRCCPWYRRRHRGIVYGVQAPVVNVVQNPTSVPNYNDQAQNHYVPYPTNPAGIPQHPPPQYTSEAYAKQAPYNPAYNLQQ